MKTTVLLGPFLTRKQAARSLGIARTDMRGRPDLLRITGLLEECYFEFQCCSPHMSNDIGRVVLVMRGARSDIEIADWMVRQNSELRELSPLAWIQYGLGLRSVVRAAEIELGRA